MPKYASQRFGKRGAPYTLAFPRGRIGAFRARRRLSMDEEAIARAVASSSTAIPRSLLPAGSRGMSINVHKFARWNETRGEGGLPGRKFLSCNFPASGIQAAGLNFKLSEVSHSTELRALYDSYRIDKVELWFDYSPDAGMVNHDFSSSLYPKLWIKRDYNDSNTPTLSDMEQSNQTQCLRFGDDRNTIGPYIVRPAVQSQVFQDPSFGVANYEVWGSWQKNSSPEVPHFGVKLVAQGFPGQNMGQITIRVRYHLTMKNVR